MTDPMINAANDPTAAPVPADAPPGTGLRPDSYLTRAQQRLAFAAFAAVALLACLVFRPWSLAFISRDSTFYFFLAERAANGVPPHVSAFTPQNALSVLIPALAIRAGDLVGLGPVATSRLLSIPLFAVTVATLGLFTYRLTRNRLASLFTVLSLTSFTWLVLMASTSSQPKLILVAFVALTMLAVHERKFAWAGLFAAGCFLSYQPGLIMLAALVAVAALQRRRGRSVGLALGAAVAAILAYEAYFVFEGALAEQIEQSLVFPSLTRVVFHNPLEVLGYAHRFWRFGAGAWNLIPAVFVVATIVFWISVARGGRAFLRRLRETPGWLFLHIALLPIAIYALLDLGGAADLFFIMPFVAVLSGIALAALIGYLSHHSLRAGHSLTAVLLLGLILVATGSHVRMNRLARRTTLKHQRQLAAQVQRWRDEGNEVYALGATHLLAFIHAPNWSMYSSSYAVRPVVGYHAFRHGPGPFKPKRDGRLPDIILWNAGQPVGWPDWLEAHYREITTRQFERQRVTVWKIRREPGG